MALVRAPGVYFEPNEQRISPLELGETGVPVFVGITRRGPISRPVRIDGLSRFTEIFGEAIPDGYLGAALSGFFDNGGNNCHVLRVARLEGTPDDDIAQTAVRHVLNQAGQKTLRIEAQDPGTWGNQLQVSIKAVEAARTFLTRDGDSGDETIQIKSPHNLTAGTVVRIFDQTKSFWTVVQAVKGKTLTLANPLNGGFISAAPTYVAAHTFDLTVREYEREERYRRLSLFGHSPRYVERVVNEQSRLIKVSAIRHEGPLEKSLPMDVSLLSLVGGADGLTDLGPSDFIGADNGPGYRHGLACLVDYPDIDLLVLPDLMAAYQQSKRFRSLRDVEVVQDAAITLCERSQCRFAILDVPPGGDYEEALRWRRQFDSAHAALFFPWVVTVSQSRRRVVPPSGHIAGIFARSDRNVGVHKAPANEVVEGIVDFEVILQDSHLALLNEANINCLRYFGSRGLRVWGSRTVSSDPEWRYINVRRTVSAISYAIERGTQWVVFEPNSRVLWKRLTRQISAFLMGLREKQMLEGSIPEEAFFVQCDAETNPPETVDAGMVITRIGLAVVRPVEFIVFRLSQRLEEQAHTLEE